MPTALIVEDEPEANRLLAMLVQLRGYRTESAFTGSEAIEKAERHRPDVVLLDLMLPDITGFDVCRALKARRETNPIPVVMVTARVAADNRLKSFRVGASDYVPKPYTPDQIFRALIAADSWKRDLREQAGRGEIPLGPLAEADTLSQSSRLLSLLLARTAWDESEVRRLGIALLELARDASEWGTRHGVDLVATASYQQHSDRVALIVRDEAGWFSPDAPARDRLDLLIPHFDTIEVEAAGAEAVMTKRFAAEGDHMG